MLPCPEQGCTTHIEDLVGKGERSPRASILHNSIKAQQASAERIGLKESFNLKCLREAVQSKPIVRDIELNMLLEASVIDQSGILRRQKTWQKLCVAKKEAALGVRDSTTRRKKKLYPAALLQPHHQPTQHITKMAKDRSEKKEKKEKRKSVDASGVKKEKKEKRKSDATAVLNAIEDAAPGAVAVDADGDVIVDADVVADESSASIPLGALVPFANPLCDEKATKKVLKTVKKGESMKPFSLLDSQVEIEQTPNPMGTNC